MSDIKKKRAPSVSANQRAWTTVYDDLNDVINSVNQKSAVESRDGTSGLDGDIRLFKDIDKSKYFIEGKFKDGWAKRELLFSDSNNETQDESINFSATESYIKPDGTVPFTDKVSGITPTNTAHLATKGYADTGRLTSITKSGNNLVFGMTDTASNITFSQFGSNAFNSTSIPTTFVASLTNADASGQTLIEASTGSLYRLGGGDNITITTDDPGGGQTWVQIDCDINTNNFLASSDNRVEGIRKHSADAFDFTQSAGSGKYIVIDDDNSNVSVTESTVTIANGTSYNAIRLNAPNVTDTNTTYSVSIPSATTKLRLTAGGSGSGTDDIEFVGSGATSVARTTADKFTITSSNNFITGASCNSNGLLTLTGTGSAGATVDLGEHLLTTVTSSHVTTALGFTPYNNTNPSGYITASSTNTLTNKGGNISQWTNDSAYLTGNQTITLSGDASGSGTTSITVTVANDSHTHNTQYYTKSTIDTTLADYAQKASPTFTGDVTMADLLVNDDLWINGQGDNTASRIRFHHNGSNAYQDWETGAYYIRYDTTSKYMMDSSGNFHADADVYAYSTSVGSDRKLKTNIKDIKYGLKDVLKLRGVDFDWKEKRDGVHDIGVIAQEVKKVIPEVVQEVKDLVEDTYLSVDYAKLVPVLIEAIKELKEEIDGLRKS